MRLFWQRVIYCVLMLFNIIAILSIISYIIGLFCIDTSKYTVSSKKIPKAFNGYKILQLSDLHSRSFGKDNEKLLKKIHAEKPDIIVLTGDMISTKDTDFSACYNLVKNLTKTYPVYYIAGNHEQRLPLNTYNKFLSTLMQHNVKILNNQSDYIFKNADFIVLHGFTPPLSYYSNHLKHEAHKEMTTDTLTQVIQSPHATAFNILLSHNPLYFDTYAEWGADLTLSGHIHGGMIRLPLIGGLLSPERKFFPKYSAGKYEKEDATLIVSRGLGNGTINLRIFNHPEINVIQLKSE